MNGPIYNRLLRSAADRMVPAAVLCNLTWRCPLSCRHCYVVETAAGRPELSVSEYNDLFAQLAREGTFWLTLTGGEPLVRPDLLDIVAAARGHHFAIRLFTSGMGLDGALAGALAAAGLSGVEISLESTDPALHDAFTGRPGSWEAAVAAARYFRERGVNVAFKACAMDFNAGEIGDLYKFAAANQCSFRHSPFVTVGNDGGRAPLRYRMRDDQLAGYYALFTQPAGEKPAGELAPEPAPCDDEIGPRAEAHEYVLTCAALANSCAIDPYGDVWPCVSLPIFILGNVRETPFGAIWRGEAATRFRALAGVRVPECEGCELVEFCARCPANAALEDGDITRANKEQCRHARAFARARGFTLPEENPKK